MDRIGNGLSLIFYSMPYFVIGMPLIMIFASGLGWFPTSGMFTVGATYDSFPDQLLDFLAHLALPLATVSLGLIGAYSIVMRSSIIETRGEDYVTTARAKGLTDGRILRSHAFPNALLPTVTIIGINSLRRRRRDHRGDRSTGPLGTDVDAPPPDYPVLQGIFLLSR